MAGKINESEWVDVSCKPLPPHRWICKLKAVSGGDNVRQTWYGTGFKIAFRPRFNQKLIVTAGSVLFRNGMFAERVYVTFPGEDTITVFPGDLFTSQKNFMDNGPDFGLITIPGDSNDGFGWACHDEDEELLEKAVSVCGFAKDEHLISQWKSTGIITEVTPDKILYSCSSRENQIGSPVYGWYKDTFLAFGVHVKDGQVSCGTRFCLPALRKLLSWRAPIRFSIQSNQFKKAYLRATTGIMKGAVRSNVGMGFGWVNCQQHDTPPHITEGNIPWEVFDIIPIFMPSSLCKVDDADIIVAIGSVAHNIFLRMNGTWPGVTFGKAGFGAVNCSYKVGEWELFQVVYLGHGHDLVAIRSVAFPNTYLRCQAKVALMSSFGAGFGTVNCQRYVEGQTPKGYEVFRLHKA